MTTVADDLEDASPVESIEPAPDPAATRFARTRAARVIEALFANQCIHDGNALKYNPFRTKFTGGTYANNYEGQDDSIL